MTTTIYTSLIIPFCELYYKSKASDEIQQYSINTIRSFGSADNTINFGFEIETPITYDKIFTPTIQLGVFTTNSNFAYSGSITSKNSSLNIPELNGSGIVTYKNKTLPLIINITPNNGQVQGFTTAILTKGVPYDSNNIIDNNIIRSFESYYCQDMSNSILIFVNFLNATIYLDPTNGPTMTPNSLFNYQISSYRIMNGFGQFNSYIANQNFISNMQFTDVQSTKQLYEITYAFVYNWKNLLTWNPSFNSWYANNKYTLSVFIRKFLTDYFGL